MLDAQHFGVPQRRRRVFIVGRHSGDWRSATEVLFERESVCGDSDPSEASWEDLASSTSDRFGETSGGLHTRPAVVTQNQRGDLRVAETSTTLLASIGSNNTPYAFEPVREGEPVNDESSTTPFIKPDLLNTRLV